MGYGLLSAVALTPSRRWRRGQDVNPPRKRGSSATVHVLARNVREARESLGLSQEQLGRAAKVDAADVSDIENAKAGSRGIGLAKLERLATALRRTPSQLLSA
jgi:ribosome-binding protein aMBF1 (putative translation factor)